MSIKNIAVCSIPILCFIAFCVAVFGFGPEAALKVFMVIAMGMFCFLPLIFAPLLIEVTEGDEDNDS